VWDAREVTTDGRDAETPDAETLDAETPAAGGLEWLARPAMPRSAGCSAR